MRHRTSARHEVGHHKGNRSGGRGRQGIGGLHTSDDVGEQGHPWTRPSKGGPCRCELLKGPMGNALTLESMSPGLQEVVGRHVATSRIGGGAGCGKSARPDLARGRVRVTARPTLQRHFPLVPSAACLRQRPLLAPVDGGVPSTQRLLAKAARSKTWHGNARPGQTARDGVR